MDDETKIYEKYLMDEKVEDVLVGYAVPPKARGRLRKLQQALHETRKKNIRMSGSPVLEGVLFFGSFTRGKPEPGDIDIVPFFDFSQYTPEEDGFRDLIKKSNQINRLINAFGGCYRELGGTPHLELVNYSPRDYPSRHHIDCTSDHLLAVDYSQLNQFFTNLGCLKPLADKFGFHPRVEHILGPHGLKDRFKRITGFD